MDSHLLNISGLPQPEGQPIPKASSGVTPAQTDGARKKSQYKKASYEENLAKPTEMMAKSDLKMLESEHIKTLKSNNRNSDVNGHLGRPSSLLQEGFQQVTLDDCKHDKGKIDLSLEEPMPGPLGARMSLIGDNQDPPSPNPKRSRFRNQETNPGELGSTPGTEQDNLQEAKKNLKQTKPDRNDEKTLDQVAEGTRNATPQGLEALVDPPAAKKLEDETYKQDNGSEKDELSSEDDLPGGKTKKPPTSVSAEAQSYANYIMANIERITTSDTAALILASSTPNHTINGTPRLAVNGVPNREVRAELNRLIQVAASKNTPRSNAPRQGAPPHYYPNGPNPAPNNGASGANNAPNASEGASGSDLGASRNAPNVGSEDARREMHIRGLVGNIDDLPEGEQPPRIVTMREFMIDLIDGTGLFTNRVPERKTGHRKPNTVWL